MARRCFACASATSKRLEHAGGVSPAWPIKYQQLAPYYDLAEQLYGVHGQAGADPTEPPRASSFPFPALDHEPVIAKVAAELQQNGIKAFPLPLAVHLHPGPCIRCKTCDGFPCKVHAKGDAEVSAVRPALATGKLDLKLHAKATRLLLTPDGKRVNAVEYEIDGEIETITAKIIVLSASAVNSAVLLLRSACDKAPQRRGQFIRRRRPPLHGAQQHRAHERRLANQPD